MPWHQHCSPSSLKRSAAATALRCHGRRPPPMTSHACSLPFSPPPRPDHPGVGMSAFRRILRSLVGVAVLLTSTLAVTTAATGAAHATTTGPVVGFWAGQNLGGFCGPYDPTTCPRPQTSYTSDVWQALVDGHGKLGFNLIYGSD